MSSRFLSIEQEKELVQEYLNGVSVKVLMEKYGFKSKKSITDKVKRYTDNYEEAIKEARKNRKEWEYSFEKIKNNFDAYFIGLLMTDGYLTTRGQDIGLDLIDEDCISFLSKVIGKEYKTYLSKEENKQARHRIILSGEQIVKEAKRYGIEKNKTCFLKGFDILEDEEKFIPYLIRGIIDGDGCIFKTSYQAPAFYIVSKSKDFIYWTKKLLENKLYFNHLNIHLDTRGLYRLETAHKEDILKLIILVYNKPFGMNRKYNLLRKTFRDYNGNILFEDDGIVQTITEMA